MGLYGDLALSGAKSQYVDPNLDLFLKASTTLQQKHDINSASFDAIAELNENLKHSVHRSTADQAKAQEIMGATNTTLNEATARGDFANMDRELRKAGRDFSSQVKPLQDNYKAIQEYEKQKAALGEQGLDFNPATNFSTYNQDGTTNVFSSDVQKMMDYNGKMREHMALRASTKPSRLRNMSDIAYMMKSGSIEAIEDEQVRKYAEETFNTYKNNAEYAQQFRKLTELEGMTAQQADAKIAKDLFNIGKAQVYTKETEDYMQNETQAKLDAERLKAASGEGQIPSIYAGIIDRTFSLAPDGQIGGNFSTEDLGRMVPGNQVTVTKDGIGYKAVNVSGEKIINFAELSPESLYNLNSPVGKAATQYYEQAQPLLEQKERLETQLKEDASIADAVKAGTSKAYYTLPTAPGVKIPSVGPHTEGYKKMQKDLADLNTKLGKIGKDASGNDLGYAYKPEYETVKSDVLKGNNAVLKRVGKILGNMTIPARMDETDPHNSIGVHDGTNPNMYGKMIGSISGKDIIDKFNYDGGLSFGREGADMQYLVDNGLIGLKKGEAVDPEKTYDLTFWNKINTGGTQGDNYDNAYYKGSKLSQENTMTMRQHRLNTVDRMNKVQSLVANLGSDKEFGRDENGGVITFKDVRQEFVNSIKTKISASKDANEASILQQYAKDLERFETLSPYKRQELIQKITPILQRQG